MKYIKLMQIIDSLQSTVYSLQSTVYSLQFTVYSNIILNIFHQIKKYYSLILYNIIFVLHKKSHNCFPNKIKTYIKKLILLYFSKNIIIIEIQPKK
mgnify:CR=1 FL=1